MFYAKIVAARIAEIFIGRYHAEARVFKRFNKKTGIVKVPDIRCIINDNYAIVGVAEFFDRIKTPDGVLGIIILENDYGDLLLVHY